MRRWTTLLFMLMAGLTAAFAQDLTGTYSGTIRADTPGGPREQNGVVVIKEDGGKLAITAGPNMEEQYPATKIDRNGDALVFEVGSNGEPGKMFKFEVTVKEGKLSGQVTVSGGPERLIGKLEFLKQ